MTDLHEPSCIETIVGQIRSIVMENCEVRYQAMRCFSTYAKLCTCMDIICDAQNGIEAFEVDSHRDNFGPNYLMVYGLFQAFVIQQDAVTHLCEALKEMTGHGFIYTYKSDDELGKVRKLRNEIVGHPTLCRSETKGTASYHSISRFKMTSDGISILSEHMQNNLREFREISIVEKVEKQKIGITTILKSALCELQDWHEAYKAKFCDVKLVSLFSPNYDTLFSKIHASINSEMPHSVGIENICLLMQAKDDLDAKLQERNLSFEAYPGIENAYRELQDPIEVLQYFFGLDADQVDDIFKERAHIMADFVKSEFVELHTIAGEVDKDFEEAPGDKPTDASMEQITALNNICQNMKKLIKRSNNE